MHLCNLSISGHSPVVGFELNNNGPLIFMKEPLANSNDRQHHLATVDTDEASINEHVTESLSNIVSADVPCQDEADPGFAKMIDPLLEWRNRLQEKNLAWRRLPRVICGNISKATKQYLTLIY